MDNSYRIRLADIEFNYKFLDANTWKYFQDYILEETTGLSDLETSSEDMIRWAHLVPFDHEDSYLEQRLMALKLSNYLLKDHACLIHACAVIWKDKAWLFAGPSGTGKTTLYRNWYRLLGKEIQILCGDMPFVKVGENGKITVFPSPWRGKENYGSLLQAPLGGILYLDQAQKNVMVRRSHSEIAAPLYTQFLCVSDCEKTIKRISMIEERILETVPVWHFLNKGDPLSAVISSQAIAAYLRSEKNEKI